ncbi:MAG: PucR family transcriptional regulator, partial [Clostridia bacterium]|nr:PucR family transcriptional regulator [Clostridia bacterium]
MSNRLFQGIIHQMRDAVDRIIGVVDDNGVIIACSELVKIGEMRQGVRDELAYTSDAITSGGYTYKPIGSGSKWEYIVFIEGEDKYAEKIATILAVSLSNIKNLYDEKYDKNSFIKNIILDNILPSDIYIKSKELRFNAEETRVVFLIKFHSKSDVLSYDMIQNIFPDKNKDYVISTGEQDIVLVKEVKPNTDIKEIEKIAKSIADTLNSEFYVKVSIGIGTVVDNIKDLARSYKEAQVAFEVGKVFDTEKNIIS